MLRFFLFIFNSFLARVYYHSQFRKKKFARNFYDYAFNRSIYVIRIFFLDRRIWNFKDFELSRSIFFPGIFGLILIPFGWLFINVWFLGFLKVKQNNGVSQNFLTDFWKTNVLGLFFTDLNDRSIKAYFLKMGYYKFLFYFYYLLRFFAIIFFLNWSSKFPLTLSIFSFWNVVPFLFAYLIFFIY